MGLRIYYGGTFDPVHNGHLAIARAARDALNLPIRLLPAADPPHRPAPGASAEQRCRMLQLALADETGLLLDRHELERAARHRQRPSYTVDTLTELRQAFGADTPLAWLVGADSLLSLATWHRWQDLFGLAHFIVAERPGSSLPQVVEGVLGQALHGRWTDQPQDLEDAAAGRVLRLHQPLRSESASEVRARIAAGGTWQALVPPAVAGYITGHRLYGV
ncbi:nicotinic acid mononucleotide adenylyltransferase [Stenotrophomonas sp. Betaine-02u-21]|uniref:nicotinate-nucleotide adenylyltransferase n=1 Tax=unclassified Stenotrophomonas TaxID=196198 RepID=UPI000C3345E7|nr:MULTISPECIES: nicotinate-nucleotide adenylyltransferase [unclassified Stenotrophomonas]PKH70539.1 nicotinic acid mononucleotide adenylyltransferase [Stenotrophomonas sp. Betaine-02u-23]PKH73408.1 nicotinic acid mononucleotide adenylyltransferase [Stenotrophomonas sp. Betaine-02u-21]PKH95262.1 nicotinic acid mononucleotide adenylyltransferase [Stenotrophomonas sp. Bg11-02]